ncbi:bacteriophage T4 gp5 trimerisation domain-containing protein, partial [Pseudomonas cichorii]|uniref:bacteriophage T4 gp5 trimerisation domain-containing protein n=3 Tax=Pseudomonas cichorii TaxID=36746 RepID=UPI0039080255
KKGAEQIYLHAQRDWDENIEHDQKIRVGNERHDTVEANTFSEFKAEEHRITHLDRKTEARADDHLTVGATQHVKVGTAQFVEAGREIHYYAGDKVVLEGGMEFTAKAGGSFIKIDAGGVTISGAQVKTNSGGSPGAGSGIQILAALLPGLADKDRFGQLLKNAPRSHKARYLLQDEKTGEPLVGSPYTLKLADGTRIAGYTNEEGKTFLAHSTDPVEVELLTPVRKPEPEEPLIRAGESAPKEMTLDFKDANSEG